MPLGLYNIEQQQIVSFLSHFCGNIDYKLENNNIYVNEGLGEKENEEVKVNIYLFFFHSFIAISHYLHYIFSSIFLLNSFLSFFVIIICYTSYFSFIFLDL